MRRFLRWSALVIVILSAVVWAGLGANRGWTKTQIQVRTLDPVTGLESVGYESKFMPGVELLAVAMAAASGLAAISFFFKSSTKNNR